MVQMVRCNEKLESQLRIDFLKGTHQFFNFQCVNNHIQEWYCFGFFAVKFEVKMHTE